MTESTTPRWWSGDLYEPYVGRWSRLVARQFVAWLDAPAGLAWLDVGCGTGALAEAIVAACAPGRIAGVDPSAGFLDFARQRLGPRVELLQGDAQDLPFAAGEFDRVVSGLMLNFVPDRVRAVLGNFARGNPHAFHRRDGAGYRLLGEQIAILDAINPQVAARLLSALENWRRYDTGRQAQAEAVLRQLQDSVQSPDGRDLLARLLA